MPVNKYYKSQEHCKLEKYSSFSWDEKEHTQKLPGIKTHSGLSLSIYSGVVLGFNSFPSSKQPALHSTVPYTEKQPKLAQEREVVVVVEGFPACQNSAQSKFVYGIVV